MKKFAALLLFILLAFTALPQPCLPEGITFTTQAQIDNFQTEYPGCTEIEGNLEIFGEDIQNLDSLYTVTSITGSLVIGECYHWPGGNPSLISLKGLNNLTKVGGNLDICQNEILPSFDDLIQISNVGGNFFFRNNKSIKTLSGLESLDSVRGDMLIWFNDSLDNLSGLNNVNIIEGSLMIEGNDFLKSLDGLENLSEIKGDLIIGCLVGTQAGHYNLSLSSLDSLKQLNSIGGELFISVNKALYDLSGLENLTSIGALRIEGNPVLEDISALMKVTSSVNGLDIGANEKLNSLYGIDNFNLVDTGFIGIRINPNLSYCNVQSICNYLIDFNEAPSIYDNANGCNSYQEITDSCWVSVNETYQLSCLKIRPNPFTFSTTIEYNLTQPQTVTINIFNQLGTIVEQFEQQQPEGPQQVIWAPSHLPAGIYYYRLLAGEQLSKGKVVKM